MTHFIIVANGQFQVREIIDEAIQDKIIIALDGAADRLARLSILPHIIVGDFDSIDKKAWAILETDEPHTGRDGVLIVPWKDQNLTDLTKAIRYCDAQQAASITLVCATGNRSDHHEGTVRALRAEYKKERPILLHTEQQTLRFAKDETAYLHGEIGDKCGIVALPAGSFSSQGLEYDVNNFVLEFGFAESTCNALRTQQAVVQVQGEALLIMPPMLRAQRYYMQKTEVERLQLQLRDAIAKY